jgi:hypothetical protein
MLHIKDKISISVDQARYILEKHTETGGVYIDLDRSLDYQSYFIEKMRPLVKPWRELAGDPYLVWTERKRVAETLVKRFNVPEYKLLVNDKLSTKDEIISALKNDMTLSEDTLEFLNLFSEIVDYDHRVGYLEQYTNLPLCKLESFENHRMVLARPTWNILNTSRISASKPSVQNVYRDFADLVTYPKGWLLVRADSGQIEPRITFSYYIKDPLMKKLILLYNDAYYGQLHFISMSDEEDSHGRSNLDEIVKMELPKTSREFLKKMGLSGTYGGLSENNTELGMKYKSKIVNHVLRKRWEEEVKEQVNNGVDTFYTAFGTAITPGDTQKYKVDSPGWKNHLIRCGINNPIQGTAGDLMCESIYVADKILTERAKGISWIGYYKHDEGQYYLQECDEKLIPDLIECTSYQVTIKGEDWIPIYSEEIIGKKKGIEEVTEA